jgi:sugar/nucleoside kinase (ribokinase family)
MLTVIGDLIADVVVLGPAALEVGTDNPAVITHARGGSAANVAAAAARSTAVRFIGRVGTDPEGDALAYALAATGVDVRVQRDGRTGSVVILVDESAERTMLTDRGAAAELDAIDPAWLDGTRWLHVPLYGFAEPASRAALLGAAQAVRAAGARISLDVSSVASLRMIGPWALRAILATLAPAVVFANLDEAHALDELGVTVDSETVFVVKRGGDPVLVRTGGSVAEVRVERVTDAVDSTGAGDAFAAGFVVAAMSRRPWVECARAGAVLAKEALRRPGAI